MENEFFDEVLKKAEADARAAVEAGTDEGHNELIHDIEALLNDAKNFEFHDQLNERFATPKRTLVEILETIIAKVKNGKYDN